MPQTLLVLQYQVAGTPLAQLELVVFGQSRPAQAPDLGFPIHYSGHLYDDLSLRLLYAAADVFVIPSRQDNLPNTGMVDIIDDRSTGALAEPFEPSSLAAAIGWVLEDPQRQQQLGAAARQRAERLWNPERVAGLVAEVHRQALERGLQNRSGSPSLR